MGDTIDWGKYVDGIYCVHFEGHSTRIPRLDAELDRVGILGSGLFTMHTVPRSGGDAWANITNNTIACLDMFLDSGGKRVAMLENDIAFLRDTELLESILQDIPDGSIAQLDYFTDMSRDVFSGYVRDHKVSKYFFDAQGVFLASGAFYVMDRGAVEEFRAALIKYSPTLPDQRLRFTSRRVVSPYPPASIQVAYKGSNGCNKPDINMHVSGHSGIGISYSDYSLPAGYTEYSLWYDPDAGSAGGAV